ncbi:DUF3509 domain-containing protein [Pseudomonas sp. Marseille-QA0892]
MMRSTEDLLIEALTPYEVAFGPVREDGARTLALYGEQGQLLLETTLCRAQLEDRRSLTDVVDGIRHDLRLSRPSNWMPPVIFGDRIDQHAA